MRPLSSPAVLTGDCLRLMPRLSAGSADFVLTDPPYLVRYHSRTGQTIANDNNPAWLCPAFAEMFRVLKPDSYALSFYGWNAVDLFMRAWLDAGFRVVGHVVFAKRYASSTRAFAHTHEQAYLLAKGRPALPRHPLQDVLPWTYTGNRLHPTQKSADMLRPLVEAFCPPGGLVLDPFCGSGSTLLAAIDAGRHCLGIELDPEHAQTARDRVAVALADRALAA